MTGLRQLASPAFELLDARPAVNLLESEYRRLLGYPRHHVPSERADELAAWARRWYAEHGRPWVYLREVELEVASEMLRLDGMEFRSKQLHDHLLQSGAERAMLVAVTAGCGCEDYARQLWQESRPDEYFFLEIFGSAVVEHLVATLSGRICDLAERDGLMAVSHYSPGYTGWDVADQSRLFELVTRGKTRPFPEPMEVLFSGMLKPKKSLLAVVGLTARTEHALESARLVPCAHCSFTPCQYRRASYRQSPARADSIPASTPPASRATATSPLVRDARYAVNSRALRKWAQERVHIEYRSGGSIDASFRFDGTTCSNLGRPLAFDYRVALSAPEDGYTILSSDCRPAPGDEGYKHTCAYLSDAASLMTAINDEKPLLGRPLNDVLGWARSVPPSGCHCSADSRTHKWRLALEAIHYTLAQAPARTVPESTSNPS